jgi:hypothetical protein
MQNPRAFQIDPALLDTTTQPSDRFVYSMQYVRYEAGGPDNPQPLPPYRMSYVARHAALMPPNVRTDVLRKYPDVLALANRLAEGVPERPDGGTNRAGVTVTDPSDVPSAEQLTGALASEIGFLFLDRTRIRPAGFGIGEHVMSLSLAPGEEVTIEQKTFSKREGSYEEISDQEETFDLELSSTLTNELSESLDHEQSVTKRSSTGAEAGISGEASGVGLKIAHNQSDNVDDADRETARSSVKATGAASSKVASRQRKQHKITFRISTETRFESTSKRVFRNPNPYTPIDILYFKILQRLVLSQERFGARLCWAPAVADPAANVEQRLAKLKAAIEAQVAAAGAGAQPQPPPPPPAAPQPQNISKTVNCDPKFDWFNGSLRFDFDVRIDAPPNYIWDTNKSLLESGLTLFFSGVRPAHAEVLSVSADGSNVSAKVHVGIENKVWIDSSGVHSESQGTANFTITARFVPAAVAQDPAYNLAIDQWKKAVAEWQAKDAALKAEARKKADAEWESIRKDALSKINPVHETMAVLIAHMFRSAARNDIWEIDLWERIFDWDHAAVRLYPSWWNNRPARDVQAAPTDFINASWARLFLPIRPGAEAAALRWIIGITQGPVGGALEHYIKGVTDQLRAYRTKYFGAEDELVVDPAQGTECPAFREKFICLAKWEELLPTDGTHLEVLQANTLAADDDSRGRLEDAEKVRNAQIEQAATENALRDAAASGGLGTVTTQIHLHIGESATTDEK